MGLCGNQPELRLSSERVQRGAFGACLMAEPALVADCVKAMRDAVSVPVTVKHRIGIDTIEHYDFVRDFVGTIAQAGCETFIVHARNAILKGLSPKENREIPPLRYEVAYQLKREFPQLEILINGGIVDYQQMDAHLEHVDGVMIGREAYHHPYLLAEVDARFYGLLRRSRRGWRWSWPCRPISGAMSRQAGIWGRSRAICWACIGDPWRTRLAAHPVGCPANGRGTFFC